MQTASPGHRWLPSRRHDVLSLNLCGTGAWGSDEGRDGPVLVGAPGLLLKYTPGPVTGPWLRLFVILLIADVFAC